MYDTAAPDIQDTATVTIIVDRNTGVPDFQRREFTKTIFETHEMAVPVLDLNATDAEKVCNM